MHRLMGWMLLVILWSAAGRAAGEEPSEARLQKAQTAFDQAKKLRTSGDYTGARAQAEQALSLREAVLGSAHPDVAASLNLLGDLLRLNGDLNAAEPRIQRGLSIREAALGKNHPDVAASLHTLATLYYKQGLYDKAEPFYQRSLTIREAALGKNHPDVAASLNNLALLYSDQGLYDKAEPLHQRALAIREAALGKDHPDVAVSLNNLASLYSEQGLYNQAEPLFQRALSIREAALGKDHPDVAASLNNLASLYMDKGMYTQARLLFERSLKLKQRAFGDNHPDTALALTNLALLYSKQDLNRQAEPLFQRALALEEKLYGEDHTEVARTLNNLASLYLDQRLYDRARPLYERALSIWEKKLGKNHPYLAGTLNNLALLHEYQDQDDQAEPLYLRSLAIREAALGEHHPDVATSLHNLANLYENQCLYSLAEPLHQRALSINEAALGPRHPEVARALNKLALLSMHQGEDNQAEALFQRALEIREATLGKDHSEVAQTLNHLAQLRLAQHRLDDALPLFTRAFSLSEQRLHQEALDFSESRLRDFLDYLREEEQVLYSLLRKHPEDARVRHLALSAALLRKGRALEELAHISRTLSQSLSPEDQAILDQLRTVRTQWAALAQEGPGEWPDPNSSYPTRLQKLAEEGDKLEAQLAQRSAPLRALTTLPPLQEIVERVAASLPRDGALVEFLDYADDPWVSDPTARCTRTPSPLRYLALVLFPDGSTRVVDLGLAEPIDAAIQGLHAVLANRNLPPFQTAAHQLYQLAFQPLLSVLGNTRHLFLAPDGQLSLVPFDALHDGEGFLLDSFDISYLTSGRQLLPRPQDIPPSSSISVLADPTFSGQDPLPGTRREAEIIQRLLPQARLYLGREATKQHLLQLSAPGILHAATHGFEEAPSSPQAYQNPLLHSGIILAGVAAATSAPLSKPEEARVTALELAGLNLWGTQLVVLSACDTGRGEVHLGQGIYGLRHSLMAAGAETLVTSLWKVNDGSTPLFMESYYRNLLAGQGRAAALHGAMRSLRASHPHPHDWASFISLGSEAPLRAIAAPQPSQP